MFPPAQWLREYQPRWIGSDLVAGITLAAYAIPVSLAYAALAGLPPQVGMYGYLLGGLGYALFGSSRHLAMGPTSAISLMVGGTVAQMAGGDAVRYAQIATLAGFVVASLSVLAMAAPAEHAHELHQRDQSAGVQGGCRPEHRLDAAGRPVRRARRR